MLNDELRRSSEDFLTHSDVEIVRVAYRRIALETSQITDPIVSNHHLQQLQTDVDSIELFIHQFLHDQSNAVLKVIFLSKMCSEQFLIATRLRSEPFFSF